MKTTSTNVQAIAWATSANLAAKKLTPKSAKRCRKRMERAVRIIESSPPPLGAKGATAEDAVSRLLWACGACPCSIAKLCKGA